MLVILFIPIQRYVLPGSLPFELEPYRLLVAFMFAGWIASLLVDPRVRLRRERLRGADRALILVGVLGSVLVNSARVAERDSRRGQGDHVPPRATCSCSSSS